MKHRLWDMSWMEAEEAFSRCDTVILPVGTLHGHGPTPISIDCSSVEWLAEEVGRRTGLVTLPLLPYGEDDKQKFYPGSITIDPVTLERFYVDVFRSLRRNGVRRVIVLNGHGGNREVLIRAGRAARDSRRLPRPPGQGDRRPQGHRLQGGVGREVHDEEHLRRRDRAAGVQQLRV